MRQSCAKAKTILISLMLSSTGACALVYDETLPVPVEPADAGSVMDGAVSQPVDAGGPKDAGFVDAGVGGCGDGVVQGDEDCDDGNQLDDDACRSDCRPAICGDGIRRTDIEDAQAAGYEACDDGNGDNGDACTTDCQEARCGDGFLRQGLEACDDGNDIDNDGCTNACTEARCGDGIVQADEGCDDGNRSDLDGCLNECVQARCGDGIHRQDLEPGEANSEACDDGNETNSDGCVDDCRLARCGDGFLHEELEACDDGNENDLDACGNDCQRARCGDGRVQAGEDCDDANDVDTDACRSNCFAARCGDGVRRVDLVLGEEDYEACDDGNQVQTDTCLNNCQAARCGDGYRGPGEGCDDGDEIDDNECSNTCQALSCGDGRVQVGEACDDGNDDQDDSCTNNCADASCGDGFVRADLDPGEAGFEACDDGNGIDQDACTNGCTDARCGDGLVWDGQEACDDGNRIPDDACTNDCEAARCGDQIVQAGEACDDGNLDDQDGCLSQCQAARCGDGVQRLGEGGEACDDGNRIDTDDCTNACTPAVCGDGVVKRGEEACDDGNRIDDDDCSNACALPRCGDGILQADETCDDGNEEDNDGCRADCSAFARCGDGVQRLDRVLGEDGFEACDDGNQSDSDACRNHCVQAFCGDGVRRDDLDAEADGFEACDDGNGIAADSCLNDCRSARCGDGVRRLDLEDWQQGYESCDDGNNLDGDQCPADCQVDEPEPGGEPSFDCPDQALFNTLNPWYLQAEGTVLWVAPGGDGDASSAEQPGGDPAVALARLVADGGGTLMLAEGDHVLSASAGAADITIVGACSAETRISGGTSTVISSSGGTLRISGVDLRSTIAAPAEGDERSALVEARDGHLIVKHAELSNAGAGHGIIVALGRLTLRDTLIGELDGSAVHGAEAVGSWTVQDNTFLGPIGLDGISLVDFGGSGFQVVNNSFRSISGRGLYGVDAIGSWTVQDNTFLGPIGSDGLSIVDFGGAAFTIENNTFQSVERRGVHGSDCIGSWTVQDNTFLGPIGADGISIVDFGGSGFRVTENLLQEISGYGIQGRDSIGSWTVQDNIFLGPIGLDGVMLNRVGGAGVFEGNEMREMTGNGLSLLHLGGQLEVLGSWTVHDNTFRGQIDYDGISVTGFVGGSMTVSDNSLTGILGRGILVTGSTATVTMEDNTVTDSGRDGVVVSGLSLGVHLHFNRNDINGARGVAARFNNLAGQISASNNQLRNTRSNEQGGPEGVHVSGLGIQATEVRSITLANNSFDSNQGGGLVLDHQAWGEVDDLLGVDDEQVHVVLQDNTLNNPAENLPGYALQNLPDDAQVGGNNVQDAAPDHDLNREYAAREGCGDGLPQHPEACDDGNLDPGDGCGPDCTLEEEGRMQLALGARYSCLLNPDGEEPLRCWGDNRSGQMGIVPARGHNQIQALTVGPQGEEWSIVQVATGDFHLCALAESNQVRRVYCWGRAEDGQTGQPLNENWAPCDDTNAWPGDQNGNFEGEPCNNNDDCMNPLICQDRICQPERGGEGVGEDALFCTTQRTQAVKMENQEAIEAVYKVTAGRRHSCALVRLDGRREVVCWGAFEQRQQGIWPEAFGVFDRNNPNPFDGGIPQVDVTAHRVYMQGVEPHFLTSGGDFNCILDVSGRAYCWGANDRGQLGRGSPEEADPFADVDPFETGRVWPVNTPERFQTLAAGSSHVCGLSVDMGVFCWGDDRRGQIGQGRRSDDPQYEPLLVPGPIEPALSLSAGGGHTAVIDWSSRETPRTWGDNRWGQSGSGELEPPYTAIRETFPLIDPERLLRGLPLKVAAGERHSCVLGRGGDVVCWGNNDMNQCTGSDGNGDVLTPALVTLP